MTLTTRVRASVVCEAQGNLLVVRLRDPVSGVIAFFPPGGLIEPGETPEHAAERETLEETGVFVRVDPRAVVVENYPFRWAGKDIYVTTHFFAASLVDAFTPSLPHVVDAAYNLGASWLPLTEAEDAFSIYPAIANCIARVRRMMRVKHQR